MNYREIMGKISNAYTRDEISKALIKDCSETLSLFHGKTCIRCTNDLLSASGKFLGWEDQKIWVSYILGGVYQTPCTCPNKIRWKDQNINRAFENAMYNIYEYENNLKKEPKQEHIEIQLNVVYKSI